MDALSVLPPTPAYLAARLALLALRASIGHATPLAPDRVLLLPATSAVSTDSAAQLLAAMAKPLFCSAEGSEAALVVSCRTSANATMVDRARLSMARRDDEETGGLMGYLDEQYGPGEHQVAVFGRDESLIVPQSVVDRWHAEYVIDMVNMVGDDAGNSLAAGRAEYVEARRRGAVGILRFSSPADRDGGIVAETHLIPLGDTVSGAERQQADSDLVELARNSLETLRFLTVEDSLGVDTTPPRSKWGVWQRKQHQEMRASLAQTAEVMKEAFRGRPMPPDVEAFVEECAKGCRPPR